MIFLPLIALDNLVHKLLHSASTMLMFLLPPSFLDTWSLSMSSIECRDLSIIINFLFLWSICLSYSLKHFKKDHDYLTRETAKMFILLIRFLLHSSVSKCFLVLRFSFLTFSFMSVWLMVSTSNFSRYVYSFSPNVLIPSWLSNSLPSVVSLFLLFYFSIPNSIPISWL